MKVRYFAWVRERIGLEEETVEVPGSVATVSDLIGWLSERDEGYAAAFAEPEVIRVAIDQTHAEHDEPIGKASEIAFFPPMTGG